MDNEISREFAEQEFERFAGAMDLDIDPAGLSAEDKAGLEQSRRKFVKAVMNGSLVVDEAGQPVFTPQRSENKAPITFYEPDGAMLLEMDQARVGADIAKTFRVLGAVTKTTPKRFSSLVYGDLSVCTAIVGLFLA